MNNYSVKILGSGNAGQRQAKILKQLGKLYTLTDNYMDADIISICTPHGDHADEVHEAILHKKNVFIEKPLCESINQSKFLDNMADKQGVDIYPMFQYRYAEHDPIADAMIAEFPRSVNYWTDTWRGNWNKSLGGVVQMHAVHILDLLKCYFGSPHGIHAQLWSVNEIEVETRAIINMVWDDGRQVSLGVAADDFLSPNTEDHTWSWGASEPAYIKMFSAIHGDLSHNTDDDPRLPTLTDAIEAVEMVTACYVSHIARRWVQLPMEPTLFDNGYVEAMKAFFPYDRDDETLLRFQ